MKKYKEVFHKKTQQFELRFFTLNNLSNEDSLNRFQSIIDIFELRATDFVGSCFVFQEKTLLEGLSNIDRNIVLRVKEGKQKAPHEVDFQFNGMQINEIIKLLAKIDIPLYILPVNDGDEISKVEILSNDREFSAITFRKDVYDHDDIVSKIEDILR